MDSIGPEYDLYIVRLFKGCKSGRLTKCTPRFDQKINIDPEQIVSDTVSTNIRRIIAEEMDIE